MKRIHALACSILAGTCLQAGGFGLGFQSPVDLGQGHAIVPRFDYLYATDSSTAGAINLSATANILSAGADYNFYPKGQVGKGFFFIAGLGLASASIDVTGSVPGTSASTSSHQVVLFPEGGVGCNFTRHLGAELLYRNLPLNDVTVVVAGQTVGYSFPGSLQLNLVVRF